MKQAEPMTKTRVMLRARLYSLSTLFILIFVLLFFTIASSFTEYTYFTMENLSNVINQASFLAIIGVSQMLVILATGSANLSIGSIMVFASVWAGPYLLEENHYPLWCGIVYMIVIGAVIGCINGILIIRLKMPAFIATFATMYIFRGLSWIVMGQKVSYGIKTQLRQMAQGRIFTIGGFTVTSSMIICALLVAVVSFILTRTTYGRKVYFVGSNAQAAAFSGIRVSRVILIIHIVGGAIAGFAGLMYAARVNACDASMYTKSHFDAISVALIGGVAMSGGFGNVWNCILGALIISSITSGMNTIQIPSELQTLVLGFLIILSVYLNQTLIDKRKNLANTEITAESNQEKA